MSNKLSEARLIMQKIQFLLGNLDTGTSQSKIELDLIRDYLRKLYDLTMDFDNTNESVPDTKQPERVIIPEVKTTNPPPETIRMQETEDRVEVKKENNRSEEPKEEMKLSDKHLLNQRLAMEKEILADKIKPKKSDDLRTAIDLNDKFYFINELFKGDAHAYDKAIRFLNGLGKMEDATVYVEKELAINYNWQSKQEAIERFMDSIKVKFS